MNDQANELSNSNESNKLISSNSAKVKKIRNSKNNKRKISNRLIKIFDLKKMNSFLSCEVDTSRSMSSEEEEEEKEDKVKWSKERLKESIIVEREYI